MATNTMSTVEMTPNIQSKRDMIVVEDLWKTYDMGSEQQVSALRGISLNIKDNEYVAIMGPSGSGKSTITRLLQGINRDYSGYLKIDGSDLREINLRHLRLSFGVVLQDNFLFRGSIRDNIRYGRLEATDYEVEEAARVVGAVLIAAGLIPAIIQDEKTGQVLVLFWMNKEALQKTIETGKVHSYSRSRGRLALTLQCNPQPAMHSRIGGTLQQHGTELLFGGARLIML